MTIAVIDLSNRFWTNYMSMRDSDPASAAHDWTVSQVRRYAAGYGGGRSHVGIACDARTNWRREVSPTYKANRMERPEAAWAQLQATIDTLRDEGYPIWLCDGYEADDVMATVATLATCPVDLITGDKDLRQCIRDDRPVRVVSPGQGGADPTIITEANCGMDKERIPPRLVRDYLALRGDGSDNVPGCRGIGPKKALALLTRWGSFAGIVAACEADDDELAASAEGKLLVAVTGKTREGSTGFDDACVSFTLVGLKNDAPVAWQDALADRVPKRKPSVHANTTFEDGEFEPSGACGDGGHEHRPDAGPDCGDQEPRRAAPPSDVAGVSTRELAGHMALDGADGLTVPDPARTTSLAAPVSWAMQLEPTNSGGAWKLAQILADARMFPDLPTPEKVLAAVLLGRMHGIPAIAACMNCYPVKGRMAMSAAMMIGIVMKRTDVCDYIMCAETSATSCTWLARRRGRPEVRITFTIEQARQAGYVRADGLWGKDPEVMLRWRGGTRIARMVFPDVVAGLYSREEMEDAE